MLSKLKRDIKQKGTSTGSKKGMMNGNRFAPLEVEDADEFFQLSPTEVALTAIKKPARKQKIDSVDVFELEVDRPFDNTFSIFCFFEDLHIIQNQLVSSNIS